MVKYYPQHHSNEHTLPKIKQNQDYNLFGINYPLKT